MPWFAEVGSAADVMFAGVQSLQRLREVPALVPRDALHPPKSVRVPQEASATQRSPVGSVVQLTKHRSPLGSVCLGGGQSVAGVCSSER